MTDSTAATDNTATTDNTAAPTPARAATPDVWGPPDLAMGPAGAPETEEERRIRVHRRRLAGLRWGAAVLVLALAGTGAAVAVTTPDRTDIPGLETRADGRYTFPALVLPPLPSGKPAPGADGGLLRHQADLRGLVLPAPKEAAAAPATAADAAAAPADRVACDTLAADQRDPAAVKAVLAENACRAAVAREWTAKDGTRTQIRLLRFGSAEEASEVSQFLWTVGAPKLEGLQADPGKGFDSVVGVAFLLRSNGGGAPGAPATARVGNLLAGDVVGVIEMTNPHDVPAPAFRQVVTLQSDLLG